MNLNLFIVLMEIFPFFKGPAVRKMAQADFVVVSVLSHFEFAAMFEAEPMVEALELAVVQTAVGYFLKQAVEIVAGVLCQCFQTLAAQIG